MARKFVSPCDFDVTGDYAPVAGTTMNGSREMCRIEVSGCIIRINESNLAEAMRLAIEYWWNDRLTWGVEWDLSYPYPYALFTQVP